jgi:hypothetical protein
VDPVISSALDDALDEKELSEVAITEEISISQMYASNDAASVLLVAAS